MTRKQINQKFRRTPKGCLMRAYEYAKRRIVEGRGLYLGLGICDREDFYKAFENDPRFLELHQEWISSGYRKAERPTPDRIDTTRGYLIDNIVWETYNVNTLKALDGYNHQRAMEA
jgi:hypothetical protein